MARKRVYTDREVERKLEEGVPAVDTQEVSVGDGNQPVTGIAGTTGEFVHRKSVSFPEDYTTTSTTYDPKYGAAVSIDIDKLPLTNAQTLYISYAADVGNDTAGETTTFSLLSQGTTFCEFSMTGNDKVPASPVRAEYTKSGLVRVNPQLKVTGGTGSVDDVTIDFWAKVGTQ